MRATSCIQNTTFFWRRGLLARPHARSRQNDGSLPSVGCHTEPPAVRICGPYLPHFKHLRSVSSHGFYDLSLLKQWARRGDGAGGKYVDLIADMERCVRFSINQGMHDAEKREFYLAHEALLLEYERALLRTDSRTLRPYLRSTHLPWVGERTRRLDSDHIKLVASVENHVGVKIGPGAHGSPKERPRVATLGTSPALLSR